MNNYKTIIAETIDVIFEEKSNIKQENNYLIICNNLKKLMDIVVMEDTPNETELENERRVRIYLEASRKNLMKDNNKIYRQKEELRKVIKKLEHKVKNHGINISTI